MTKKEKGKHGGPRLGSGRKPTGVTKERITVTIDKELAAKARKAKINLSAAAEDGIRNALG